MLEKREKIKDQKSKIKDTSKKSKVAKLQSSKVANSANNSEIKTVLQSDRAAKLAEVTKVKTIKRKAESVKRKAVGQSLKDEKLVKAASVKRLGESKAATVKKLAPAEKETAVKKEKDIVEVEALQVKVSKVEKVKKGSGLNIDVFDLAGKVAGKMDLPEEIFGAKINPVLMAQAVRVYLTNQRQGTVSTRTRGEVAGSTRKIYKQKGTGRARHGGIRAPIFVKGGIAHGPKPKDYELNLPKKMRRAALFSALSTKFKDREIMIVDGLDKIEMKTKAGAGVAASLGLDLRKMRVLLVSPNNLENVTKAMRNLAGMRITSADRLTTYAVLDNKKMIFMKDAIEVMEKMFMRGRD